MLRLTNMPTHGGERVGGGGGENGDDSVRCLNAYTNLPSKGLEHL